MNHAERLARWYLRKDMEVPKVAPQKERRGFEWPRTRTMGEILEDLRKPIKPKYIKVKKGAPGSPQYVPHYYIKDLLDYYAPGWEWFPEITHAAGLLYVKGLLVIHGEDGQMTRGGIGNEKDDLDGYGDPSSNSSAMALRRAAMAFGLGRELWRKP